MLQADTMKNQTRSGRECLCRFKFNNVGHLLEEVAIGCVLSADTLIKQDSDCDLSALCRQ